jgi:hypothetical protein
VLGNFNNKLVDFMVLHIPKQKWCLLIVNRNRKNRPHKKMNICKLKANIKKPYFENKSKQNNKSTE